MNTLAEALRLYQDGQYDEAARRLRIFVEFDRTNAQAWMYYGAALSQLKRWSQAVEAFRQVTQLEPEETSAYCDLAAALFELGRVDQAEAAVNAALLLEPRHPAALELRERIRGSVPTPVPAEPTPATPETNGQPAAAPVARARRRRRPRRVEVLWSVLALLLLVVAISVALEPAKKWRRLREAAAFLDRVQAERTRLAKYPGEDFAVADRLRQWYDQADARVRAVGKRYPGLPEVHLLASRLHWGRDHDSLGTKNDLLQALAHLKELPPQEERPLGLTVAQMTAECYQRMAETDLAERPTPESVQHARASLAKAQQADPAADVSALEARITQAEARLRATTG